MQEDLEWCALDAAAIGGHFTGARLSNDRSAAAFGALLIDEEGSIFFGALDTRGFLKVAVSAAPAGCKNADAGTELEAAWSFRFGGFYHRRAVDVYSLRTARGIVLDDQSRAPSAA